MACKCRHFEGKIGLITGGSNGIGNATAHRLVDDATTITGTTLPIDSDRAGLEIKWKAHR